MRTSVGAEAEQEAPAPMQVAAASMPLARIPRDPASVLALQSNLGNQATAALLARQPTTAPPADKRLDELERKQRILEKRQKATEQDNGARAKFTGRLAGYRRAAARITTGLENATQSFTNTNIAQAQSDALAAQLLGGVAAIGFAAGFEWMFSSALGALGKTTEQIAKAIEKVENPANALVSASVNVAGVLVATASAKTGGIPPGGMSGTPLAFLSRNLEIIAEHEQKMENAFTARAAQLGQGSDEAWEAFDPKQQQAIYDKLEEALAKVALDVERLKSEGEIAAVSERHLWALWIKQETSLVGMRRIEGTDTNRPMPKAGEAKVEDIDEMKLAIGADREARLVDVGVASRAGVFLTGHWYLPNSPADWRKHLWVWAMNHKESIST